MTPIRRIGHATFATTDLGRSIAYYTDVLGLSLIDRGRDVAYLAATGDVQSVVLKTGDAPMCARLALQVAPDAELDDLIGHMKAFGLSPERRSDPEPDIAELITIVDPAGLPLDIFRARSVSPRLRSSTGIVPRKLGHTAFVVGDVQKQAEWYRQMLGFRVSDWIGDFFVFMRCGPDHHTVNFLRGDSARMHHIAFELNDWGHVKDACVVLIAGVVAAATVLSSAAQAMTEHMATMRLRGKTMHVHVMQMDDGSTLYGFTKAQVEEITRRRADSMFTSNPR